MILTLSSIIPLTVIITLITICIQRRHILIALLTLEAIILILIIITIIRYYSELYTTIIILSIGACEASLGLGCLVAITRTYGNDLIKSTNINKC